MDRAEILARFPEFACLVHKVRYLTARQNELLLARLARHAVRSENGRCILWTGAVNNDCYGRMSVWLPQLKEHGKELVHRLVWLMKTGKPIPPYREISHGCDTPPCFNPSCLKAERIPDNRKKSAENTNRKKARRVVQERFSAMSREA